MKRNRLTVNPRKCEWAVQETDWLGYWLTLKGLKPWHKKIDAILRMDSPRNFKQMQRFLASVNYYRDMWSKQAHILSPLSEESGKKNFHWTDEMDKALLKMKAILSANALMAYPNHNKPFHIYKDASYYQIGAVIMQNKKPVAY